jgi:hypothetical protein
LRGLSRARTKKEKEWPGREWWTGTTLRGFKTAVRLENGASLSVDLSLENPSRSRSGNGNHRSIARLKPGFRAQTMASRRERTKDSPTRWRFRLPSPGTFRLQPCGGPRTAFGPGFNLIALRGRRSRDSRLSLRPGQEFAARACRSLRRYRSAGAAPPRSSPEAKVPTAPQTLKGGVGMHKLDLHAAASYSWTNPPSRSRRRT